MPRRYWIGLARALAIFLATAAIVIVFVSLVVLLGPWVAFALPVGALFIAFAIALAPDNDEQGFWS